MSQINKIISILNSKTLSESYEDDLDITVNQILSKKI